MRRMPGTNLTRDEAATRAALLDVTSYSIDLDLTTGDTTPSPRPPRSRSPAASPGPRPSPTSSSATVARDHAQRRVARRRVVRRQPHPAAATWPADNVLVVRADLPYSHTGEGLHRFVDPVDDRVYLYSPVRGARRAPRVHHLRAARPQVRLRLPGDRPRPLGGRLQLPHARAGAGRRGRPPCGASRRPSGCRPTSPPIVAGEYHAVFDTYQGQFDEIPLGHYCRQSLVEHLDREELVKITSQSFAFFEDSSTSPTRSSKYDQLYVPEYNMGAMENAGCVTLRDEYLPRSPPAALVLRVPLLGDHPRDGPHVVRRPGDHEVVGRPLAQRVVRRVGLLLVRGRGHRVHRRLDRLRQRAQADRLPRRPAAEHPPDRGRQLRPRGRRGQLRHDHLRQGRLGAQAAGGLGRARPVRRRAAPVLHATTPTATPSSTTCWPPSSGPRAASSSGWAEEWLQTAGVNTLTPEFELDADGAYSSFSPSRRPPTPTTPRCAATASASACTTRSTAAWCAATTSRSTSRARAPTSRRLVGVAPARPAAAQRRRPGLRQDPPRRALAGHRRRRPRPASTTPWPAPWSGARPGT